MPYKKGESGNPRGRPKGSIAITTQVQQLFLEKLAQPASNQKKGARQKKTKLDEFLEGFMESATDPKSQAFKILSERILDKDILANIDSALNKSKKEDNDFLQYRIVKRAFDEQYARIMSKKKLKLSSSGRRAGKTDANILEASACVIENYKRVLIIGLSFQTAVDLYFDKFVTLFEDLGLEVNKKSKIEGTIELHNGSVIFFRGNSTIDERNKARGFQWDLVIIDEAQSQKELKYLIEDIIDPTLIDRQGTLVVTGSGPRIRGTYWEWLWNNANLAETYKSNWNLSHNPFIPNHKEVLKDICEKKNIDPNSPLFKREYLGLMDAFDDDALVYRLTDHNFYTDEQLQDWIESQPVTDIHATAGLDFGWTDSDGFVIILYSDSKPEKFVIYEHKKNRESLDELVTKLKEGMNESTKYTHNFDYVFCDTSDGRTTATLSDTYDIPTMPAYKMNKDLAVEVLQDEVRQGRFKVKKGSVFEDEAMHTVFARNENDHLTRVIDDKTYHPDLLDAVLYALRSYWNWNKMYKDEGDTQ